MLRERPVRFIRTSTSMKRTLKQLQRLLSLNQQVIQVDKLTLIDSESSTGLIREDLDKRSIVRLFHQVQLDRVNLLDKIS